MNDPNPLTFLPQKMRLLIVLLRKEFLQIFRNKAMLPILFVLPIVQLLVLSFAATFEVRNTPISLIDHDRSSLSKGLAERFEASPYFSIAHHTSSIPEADAEMQRGAVKLILHLPNNLERDITRAVPVRIQLTLDAEDGATAGVVQAYALRIITAFNQLLLADTLPQAGARPANIDIRSLHWYNPDLNYQIFMVPGILVLLVTMIGTFLSAMNVVREKEIGTIEQLNVTPLRKSQFIIGKLLPFWVIALIELGIGLVIARIVFDVPMLGNLFLVFALAGLYLMGMLGLGLWISTITETQQQAMFVAWFIMVICILMSGLFTPIESMPDWAQKLTWLNPVAYFIEIMRRVLLKGAGFDAVIRQFWFLLIFTLSVLTLAVRQYRKVST